MKTIVLLSCCKQKKEYKAPAEELYQSTGFKKSLAYAKSINPDSIYILSAKHHLVGLKDELEPYDVCLNNKSQYEKSEWSKIVLSQLKENYNLQEDKFIILAGKEYYSDLIKGLVNYELPLEGLKMGYRLQWLDEHTVKSSNLCMNIHEWVNSLPRFNWNFNPVELPENGIYFFFEKGEKFYGMDRIVRIGTHTGDNNLSKRIAEHLKCENKDRSIFRKNIGRAILNKNCDSFLEYWNIDMTTKRNKSTIDWNNERQEKYLQIEKQVTEYMRDNFTFSCIPVDNKEERLKYEQFLIESISSDKACRPSEQWLGKFSPIEKIRKSGMWLVNGLSKEI